TADEMLAPESKQIAIIGAGSWGTALALVAARNRHSVRLWAREPEVALGIETARENPYYLSDFELPGNIHPTTSIEEALERADFVLVVVPSHAMREVVGRMRDSLSPQIALVSATKGVENGTLMRMDEVIADVLGYAPRFVAFSGPSFAREVAKG